MKLRKYRKAIFISVVLIITFCTFVFCISALKTPPIDVSSKTLKIVLDAGHGGIDSGVSGVKTGVKESDLNLKVVKKLEDCFTEAGINVTLTRTTEEGLYGASNKNRKKRDMLKRKEIIEKANADLVISVHMNQFSLSSRRGAQVFFNEENENSKKLANAVQKSLNDMEEAVKKTSALKGDYYLTKCTSTPTVIVECGFLSNPDDEALLITQDYQQKIAYAIFKGAVEFLTETTFYAYN